MKPSEILEKVEALLSSKVKLEQTSLDNGTVIEAESFEAGQSVFVVTDDERIPLPVGEYTLESGAVLVVEEEGVIASMGESEEEEEMEDEVKEEFATLSQVNELKEVIARLEAVISEKFPQEEQLTEEAPEEEVKVEASEQRELEDALAEPAAKPLKHNPEGEQTVKVQRLSRNRPRTTMDNVLSRISKINK